MVFCQDECLDKPRLDCENTEQSLLPHGEKYLGASACVSEEGKGPDDTENLRNFRMERGQGLGQGGGKSTIQLCVSA